MPLVMVMSLAELEHDSVSFPEVSCDYEKRSYEASEGPNVGKMNQFLRIPAIKHVFVIRWCNLDCDHLRSLTLGSSCTPPVAGDEVVTAMSIRR